MTTQQQVLKMTKGQLIDYIEHIRREHGIITLAAFPLSKWSKDELQREALDPLWTGQPA